MQMVNIAVKRSPVGAYAVQIQKDVFHMQGDKLLPVDAYMPDAPSLLEEDVPANVRQAVSAMLPMYLD